MDCGVYKGLDLVNSEKLQHAACQGSLWAEIHKVCVEIVEHEVWIIYLAVHNEEYLHACENCEQNMHYELPREVAILFVSINRSEHDSVFQRYFVGVVVGAALGLSLRRDFQFL